MISDVWSALKKPGGCSGRRRERGSVFTFDGVAREPVSGVVTFVGRPESQKEADRVLLSSGLWIGVQRTRSGNTLAPVAPAAAPGPSSSDMSVETADRTSAKGRLFTSQVSMPLDLAVLHQRPHA